MPLSPNPPALPPIAVTDNLSITPSNQAAFNGHTLALATALTITIGAGLANGFRIDVQPPASGNASVVSSGGVLLNGATSTVNVARSQNYLFSVVQTAVDSYAVTLSQSGGGGGSPGGSTTQVQYNNAGSFGGISGAATDGTTLTLVAPVLGTPASVTLTNGTGLPVSTGVSGLGTGVATFLASPSSASLAAALTDETGTGAAVFANTPTLVTPVLGAATATSVTANAFIANSSNVNAQTGTTYSLVAGDNGKVVTLNNASAITLTVPASLGAGFACTLVQLGAGQVTVAASGTAVHARVGLKLVGQYSGASLYAYAADTFVLAGDLSA